MAGISLMALGPIQFQAMGFGFTDRQRLIRTPWAQIAVAGGMDRQQWTGGGSVTETINGVVFSEMGGMNVLDAIAIIQQAGHALPFIDTTDGLANVFGMWTIQELSQDSNVFDNRGSPIRTAYVLKIQRYEGGFGSGILQSVLGLFQ